jgi:hypothetical protein
MRDIDEMRDLKRHYLELVRTHGEDVTEFKAFKESLLELNRKHRREAVSLYVKILSKVEKKLGRKR